MVTTRGKASRSATVSHTMSGGRSISTEFEKDSPDFRQRNIKVIVLGRVVWTPRKKNTKAGSPLLVLFVVVRQKVFAHGDGSNLIKWITLRAHARKQVKSEEAKEDAPLQLLWVGTTVWLVKKMMMMSLLNFFLGVRTTVWYGVAGNLEVVHIFGSVHGFW